MAIRSLKSLIPSADELLRLDLPKLGELLLIHLKSYEGQNHAVWQHAGINREYLTATLEARNIGLVLPPGTKPEYETKQAEVTQAIVEAWDWLVAQGLLTRNPAHRANFFVISRAGEKSLQRHARLEKYEKLGLDRVKSDLMQTGGRRDVGGTPEVLELAWEWVRMKESKPPVRLSTAAWELISDIRLTELRSLKSPEFDFTKLIRVCEELNIASREDCNFATAMLTRGLLDHVPPLFGKLSFTEVANNYVGGGKSFKESMQHLQNAARKVADAHLHMPIRKSETLPVAQQVRFASDLDVLLSEIVRITK